MTTSPRPWKIVKKPGGKMQDPFYEFEDADGRRIAPMDPSKEDAELIVKAVNAYEASDDN